MAAFRDYKRWQAAGLGPFHRDRLAALHDALLSAREDVFALPKDTAEQHAAAVMGRCAALEAEVSVVGVALHHIM